MDFQFLGAEIIFNNGTIHGISTINRTSDAKVSYLDDKNKLGVFFPIDLNEVYVSINTKTFAPTSCPDLFAHNF